MLQLSPILEGRTIVVRAIGKLSHEDYQAFLPSLEEILDQHEKISMLIELDEFTGWDLDAIKDDFKLGIKHYNDFERIAIVGDKAWEHWMTLMAKPFMLGAAVRYFDRERLQAAWDWLRENEIIEKAADELKPYQRIICAVDFSIYSKHAAKRAVELAALYQANLTLLHVVPEFDAYKYYYGDFALSDLGSTYDIALFEKQHQLLKEKTEEKMQRFVNELGDNTGDSLITKIDLCPEISSGELRTTLLSYLEAHTIDLAVFGSKKKKGMEKIHGTLSHYIHNHARCEILITPVVDNATFAD